MATTTRNARNTRTTRSRTRSTGQSDAELKLHSFRLNNNQLTSVRTGRGRRTEPSELLPDVRVAEEHPGEYIGFKVSNDRPANYLIGQLRKAARNERLESRQFSIYNREKEGFVAFVVHDAA